jgi:hypothetical protein
VLRTQPVFAVLRSSSLVEWSNTAAHRATYGGVLSVTYPRLSPRRDTAVVFAVYRCGGNRRVASVWIGRGVPLYALSIPCGETGAAFPAEPTRLRVRAGSIESALAARSLRPISCEIAVHPSRETPEGGDFSRGSENERRGWNSTDLHAAMVYFVPAIGRLIFLNELLDPANHTRTGLFH